MNYPTGKVITSKRSLEVVTPARSFIRILTTEAIRKRNAWPCLTRCRLDKTLVLCKISSNGFFWQVIQLLKMGKLSLLNGKIDFNGDNKLVLTQKMWSCSLPALAAQFHPWWYHVLPTDTVMQWTRLGTLGLATSPPPTHQLQLWSNPKRLFPAESAPVHH